MQRKKAFTLIELLVVIAVIALLMAILLPVLGRVKRQAKAVICRSNLRQLGMWLSMYTQDNDDRFFGGRSSFDPNDPAQGSMWSQVMHPYFKDSNDVLLCPMAVKPDLLNSGPGYRLSRGGTFSPWGGSRFLSSYGLNYYVRNDPDKPGSPLKHPPCWKTTLVKGVDKVPVLMDSRRRFSVGWITLRFGLGSPPYYEGGRMGVGMGSSCLRDVCINRHDGYVNVLFMDWSVRRVGLKELWTLKWQRDVSTTGPWTTAGGVKPQDWPQWMRKFKDY